MEEEYKPLKQSPSDVKKSGNFRFKSTLEKYARLVKEVTEDPDRLVRIATDKCRMCHYSNRNTLAGSALTRFYCKICALPVWHHNTSVDCLCRGCSGHFELCRTCGADINLNLKRVI